MNASEKRIHPEHGEVIFVRADGAKSVVKLANNVETTVTTEWLTEPKPAEAQQPQE